MKKPLIITSIIAALTIAVSTVSILKTPVTLEQITSQEATPEQLETVKTPVKFTPFFTGGTVTFDISESVVQGTINCVQIDTNGVTRVGGDFQDGTFCFAIQPDSTTTGVLMFPNKKVYYELEPTVEGGDIQWIQKPLDQLLCVELPPHAEGGAVVTPVTPTGITSREAVPVLDSLIGAKTVLFLDFIGGKIQDPIWNGGKSIDVKPANYTVDQINITHAVAAERFSAFNINVTTDAAKYAAAPVKNRMRVILTTTNVMPNCGGYAYINSLKTAGTGIYSPTIPCFAFVNMVGNAKNAGEVAAHEFGHTFGLAHDGAPGTTYYAGQGVWAPVMGVSYYKPVVQWSKGEYANANNKQNDLDIIAATTNTGYATLTNLATPTLINTGSSFSVKDVVSNSNTSRYFKLVVPTTGTLTVSVNGVPYGGLNTVLELRDSSGSVILSKSNPVADLNARATVSRAVPGTYTVKVYGEGEGDPLTTGYSSYGSIGSFTISGSITSDTATSGTVATGTLKTK